MWPAAGSARLRSVHSQLPLLLTACVGEWIWLWRLRFYANYTPICSALPPPSSCSAEHQRFSLHYTSKCIYLDNHRSPVFSSPRFCFLSCYIRMSSGDGALIINVIPSDVSCHTHFLLEYTAYNAVVWMCYVQARGSGTEGPRSDPGRQTPSHKYVDGWAGSVCAQWHGSSGENPSKMYMICTL